jgi:NADPH2:quinone reductase
MKAVRLEAFGGPEALQFVTNAAKPVLNHGQILVHNQFAGVNYIDTYHRTGLYKVNLPYIPGRS